MDGSKIYGSESYEGPRSYCDPTSSDSSENSADRCSDDPWWTSVLGGRSSIATW